MSSSGSKKPRSKASPSTSQERGSVAGTVKGIFRRLTSGSKSPAGETSRSDDALNPSPRAVSTHGRSPSKWSPSFLSCLNPSHDVEEDTLSTFQLQDLKAPVPSPEAELEEIHLGTAFDTEIDVDDIDMLALAESLTFTEIETEPQQSPSTLIAAAGADGSPNRGHRSRGPAGNLSSARGEGQNSPAAEGSGSHGSGDHRSGGRNYGGAGGGDDDEGHGGAGGGASVADNDEDEREEDGEEEYLRLVDSALQSNDASHDYEDDQEEKGGHSEGEETSLPEAANVEEGPLLLEQGTGMNAKAFEKSILKSRWPGERMTENQKNNLRQRDDRLTRPVLDPNYPLVNYGHRRWPLNQNIDEYIHSIMRWLWPRPGGLGVGENIEHKPWQDDPSFYPRLTQLIEEFNTYGLPRTVHALLEHEIPPEVTSEFLHNPYAEAINPSYRCDCWHNMLGDDWYNETDASLLRTLGADWIISGQHLLIHLLTRMITAMTQNYLRHKLFKENNPLINEAAARTMKWSDQMMALLQKMMETRGIPTVGESEGNNNLTVQDKQLVAHLCGLFRSQVENKLYNAKRSRGRRLPALPGSDRERPFRASKHKCFNRLELLYMNKYLLRKKLFDPLLVQKHIPNKYFEDFMREVASDDSLEDPNLEKRLKRYAGHFLSNSTHETFRSGFKLRSEAIAYYNLLAQQRGIAAYNTEDADVNQPELLEMVATHMETVMTARYNELLVGDPYLSDYDARDIAAINEAGGLQAAGGTGPDEEITTTRENFGPGSLQQRLQPVLRDLATGPDRHLTSPEMRQLLEGNSSVPQPYRELSSSAAPDQAFPDVYDQVVQDHMNRKKRHRAAAATLPLPSGTPNEGGDSGPPTSPPGGGGGGASPPGGGGGLAKGGSASPPGGGGGLGGSASPPGGGAQSPGGGGGGASPPGGGGLGGSASPPGGGAPSPGGGGLGGSASPPGGGGGGASPPGGGGLPSSPRPDDDDLLDRFFQFYNDVLQQFPEMIELVKLPTSWQLWNQEIAIEYPFMPQYIHRPRYWPVA